MSNLITNMGNIVAGRISSGLRQATENAKTSQDVSIMNVRAGLLQMYGGMQLMDYAPERYALFGSSGGVTTVGP